MSKCKPCQHFNVANMLTTQHLHLATSLYFACVYESRLLLFFYKWKWTVFMHLHLSVCSTKSRMISQHALRGKETRWHCHFKGECAWPKCRVLTATVLGPWLSVPAHVIALHLWSISSQWHVLQWSTVECVLLAITNWARYKTGHTFNAVVWPSSGRNDSSCPILCHCSVLLRFVQ